MERRRARLPESVGSWCQGVVIADEQDPAPGQDAVAIDQLGHQPRGHDARPVGARDERHPVVGARGGDHRAGGDLVRGIVPQRRDHAVVPADGRDAGQHLDPRQGGHRPIRVEQDDRRRGVGGLRRGGDSGRTRPHDQHVRLEPSARTRRVPRRPPPVQRQPPPPAEPAQDIEIPLAQAARPEEPVVVERRRDPAREQPDERHEITVDRRPGMLPTRDQSVTDGDPARPDARHAVDLALAPATLAGRAHQAAWPMEPEAPRQHDTVRGEQCDRERLPLDAVVRPSVEGEPDRPCRGPGGDATRRHLSGCGRSASCRCRPASIRDRRRGLPSRARVRCRSA